jgi:hypothetical protein
VQAEGFAMKTGTCPGCLKSKQLVSSHLVSRAVYDYLRTEELHPIVAGGGTVRATSEQMQALLLCEGCERMLNDGGEKWIVGKLCTIDREFPLYELLHRQAPTDSDADGEIFAARSNAEIDVQKITHFAIGVFWKASLYSWEFSEISLGPLCGVNSNMAPWRNGIPPKHSFECNCVSAVGCTDHDEPAL